MVTAACGSRATSPTTQSAEAGQPDASSDRAAVPVNQDVTAGAGVPLPANAPVIVTFGDSLTAGVSGRSYPDQLQELLLKEHYGYRVDNQGVSGDTSTDGLARIDNVLAAHPALVVLEFGGNDGLRGLPVASTRQNLAQMIEQIQSAKVPMVLLGITLPPNYGTDYVKTFTGMFPSLAKQYKVPIMPFLLLHVYRDGALMQPDGVHPNEKGNTVVAQDVYRLIRPLLKKSE